MNLIITPKGSFGTDIKETVRERGLLYFFTWRNFRIRYKQTVIGAGWAIFRPFILMVVFTFAFNKVGNITIPSNIPYPVFTYSGLLFWTYFSQTVTQVGDSLVSFQGVIQKIYFPRLVIPISTALTGIIDFLFALAIYAGLLIYYSVSPQLLGIVLLVPMLLLSLLTVLGIGLFMAALNVRFRDVRQALPFIIQALTFLSPVVYSSHQVPENIRWLIFINPMAGVIETMHSTLLGIGEFNPAYLAISVVSCFVFLIIGLLYFEAKQQEFADVI